MRIIRDGLKFCADCACWAASGDDSGIESDKRRKYVHACVKAFGPHLVYSDSRTDVELEETDRFECDSCGSECWGCWCEFAVLGPDEWSCKPVPGAQHDGRYLLQDGKRVARLQSYGSGKHMATLAPRIVALLNAEPELSDLFDLVSELLDTHEAADQEPDYIEAKCLHQLRKVRRMLGHEGEV